MSAITRIATRENESYLLQIADHGTAAHVEQLVQKHRRCRRLQDKEESVKQHTLREFSYFYDEQGCHATKAPVNGVIDPETVRHVKDVSAETRPWESFATRRAGATCRELPRQRAERQFRRGPLPGGGARFRGNAAGRGTGHGRFRGNAAGRERCLHPRSAQFPERRVIRRGDRWPFTQGNVTAGPSGSNFGPKNLRRDGPYVPVNVHSARRTGRPAFPIHPAR